MRRLGSALIVCTFLAAGCGKVVKESASLLGLDDVQRSSPGLSGGDPQKPSSVVVVSSMHRSVEGKAIEVRVVRKNATLDEVKVSYVTVEASDGERAKLGVDFLPSWGTLRWGPLDTTPRIITIPTFEDGESEITEEFRLKFGDPVAVAAAPAEVSCFIEDGNRPPKLSTNTMTVSATKGGTQQLLLRAGPEHARRYYHVLGSFTTLPGFHYAGYLIPLGIDPWFEYTLLQANTSILRFTNGKLDGKGEALAELRFPPTPIPNVVGTRLYHAYVVYDAAQGPRMVSNSVVLRVVE